MKIKRLKEFDSGVGLYCVPWTTTLSQEGIFESRRACLFGLLFLDGGLLLVLVTDGFWRLRNLGLMCILEDMHQHTILAKEAIRAPMGQLIIDGDVKDIVADVEMRPRDAHDGCIII